MLENAGPVAREGLSSLERMLVLKKLPTIGDLPTADLAVIADVSRERFFPRGSLLLAEGEPVPAVHLIVEGAVEVSRGGVVLGHVPSGNGIGALGLLAGDPFGVNARAVEDTLTLEVESDQMFEIFEDRFAILHHILRDLCRQLIDQLVELRLDPSEVFPPSAELPTGRDLDLVERIFFLRQMPVFQKASINALFAVSRTLTEIRYPPGTVLWKEGEPSLGVFLVTNGTLRCRGKAGTEFQAGPGFPMGVAEALGEIPRWYEAVTETRVIGLQGPIETVVDVLEDNFELARQYLAATARGLIRALGVRFRRGESVPPLVIAGGGTARPTGVPKVPPV
jgi:CRP-like cAMP-binding protein